MRQRVNRADFLVEQSAPLEGEQGQMSRRDFLFRFGGAALAATVGGGALRKLADGVTLREYPIFFQTKEIGDVELLPKGIFGPRECVFARTSKGKLVCSPLGDPSSWPNEISYVHRTNSPDAMDRAIEEVRREGATGMVGLDIDVTFADEIYGNHGKYYPSIGVVVDVNERGVKLGRPKYTYEELVEHMVLLNEQNPDLSLVVSAELKRGLPPRRSSLNEMLDIHERRGVPLLVPYDVFMGYYGNEQGSS